MVSPNHVNNKIHFEISERKMILYLFDLFFCLAVFVLSYFFKLDYLETVALLRLSIAGFLFKYFGVIFDVYKLQVASNQFQIARSTIRLQQLFVYSYSCFSPILPINRLQILTFFFIL
jgi:hypothetical protein